jgi:DNA-binding IclR family transcriptional regulator
MFLETGASLPLDLGAGPRVLLAATPKRYWKEYLSGETGSCDAEDAHIERGRNFYSGGN